MIIKNFQYDNTDNHFMLILQNEKNNRKENGNKNIYKN